MTLSHVGIKFIAAETAPTASEAMYGADIVDLAGRLSLKLVQSPGTLELDTTTVPPTLHLRNAMCLVDEGEMVEGVFTHPKSVHPRDLRVGNGSYQGAGSVIELR